MRRTIIIMGFSLLWAGCGRNNPVSPITDTIQSDNLQVTFSIPRQSYGIHDTLTATTKAYNPGDTTITVYVPVCWSIAWYKVYDSKGATRLSYSAPSGYGCNSIAEYQILPHQSQQISMLRVVVPIAGLGSTQNPEGAYVLKVDDELGTFSIGFTVN